MNVLRTCLMACALAFGLQTHPAHAEHPGHHVLAQACPHARPSVLYVQLVLLVAHRRARE